MSRSITVDKTYTRARTRLQMRLHKQRFDLHEYIGIKTIQISRTPYSVIWNIIPAKTSIFNAITTALARREQYGVL